MCLGIGLHLTLIFGHYNIISFCGRPFKSVEDMDRTLIRNWNSRVHADDIVFHLGDFSMKNRLSNNWYLSKLKGHIILLAGNHDRKHNRMKTPIENMVINLGGRSFLMIHNPEIANWNGLVLSGHVHNLWKFQHFENKEFEINFDAINLSVEMWRYMPVSIEEIIKAYENWKKMVKEVENDIDI